MGRDSQKLRSRSGSKAVAAEVSHPGGSTSPPGHRGVNHSESHLRLPSPTKDTWGHLSLIEQVGLPPLLSYTTSAPTPRAPQPEGWYSLGYDGDLDKADEEEDKRGTCHVGTESVIHLLGVLRGGRRVRWPEAPGSVCSSPALPQTHGASPLPRPVTPSGTSASLGAQETSPKHHNVVPAGRAAELCQTRNFPQVGSPGESFITILAQSPSTTYTLGPGHGLRRPCKGRGNRAYVAAASRPTGDSPKSQSSSPRARHPTGCVPRGLAGTESPAGCSAAQCHLPLEWCWPGWSVSHTGRQFT